DGSTPPPNPLPEAGRGNRILAPLPVSGRGRGWGSGLSLFFGLHDAGVAAVEGEVSVVDLQGEQGQGGAAHASAALVTALSGAELGGLGGALVLLGDQLVADAVLAGAAGAEVPEVPVLPAHVVHHLRGVILVVQVATTRRRLLQTLDARQQAGVARVDAE